MAKKPQTSPRDDAVQQADDYIMSLCEPGKMNPADAVAFLGQICDRCEAAIEALREEHDLD